MCVRTKTSYGCGHTHKQDQSCRRQSCAHLERYHFENEGDCRPCKKGGDSIARGRDGQGRHAQGLSRHRHTSPPGASVSSPTSSNGGASPWASSDRGDTDWRSRIRRQADEAWEDEHAQRQEDLHSRSATNPTGGPWSARSPSPSPLSRRYRKGGREAQEAMIQHEARRMEESERMRTRRRRDRQPSYDSFESLGGSYCSCGSAPYGHSHSHGSGRRNDGSGASHRSHLYDSGFARSGKHTNPYNLYNTESYFRGLGQGFGDLVRDSGRRWASW